MRSPPVLSGKMFELENKLKYVLDMNKERSKTIELLMNSHERDRLNTIEDVFRGVNT